MRVLLGFIWLAAQIITCSFGLMYNARQGGWNWIMVIVFALAIWNLFSRMDKLLGTE